MRQPAAWLRAARLASRLLTWRRARTYALGLGVFYVVLWGSVTLRGTPPLNLNGEPIGGDYVAFYAAGRLLLTGQAHALYEPSALKAVQEAALQGRIGGFYDAFRNPPFFALVFAPLALVPLVPSSFAWTILSLGFAASALWLALAELPGLRSRWRGIAIVTFAFPPVFFCLLDGQNSTLSLLLYVLIYRSLARGSERQAGVWAALGLFKPQLFLVFPIVLAASRRWRGLSAYVATAAVLGLVSLALVGSDGIVGWLRILLDFESSNVATNSWRMHSLRTFFDSLIPGSPLLSGTLTGIASLGLLVAIVRLWSTGTMDLPYRWGVTSLLAVVVDPHIVDYDLTVLVLTGLLLGSTVAGLRWLILLVYALLLVRAQLPVGDVALQLSVPVLLYGAGLVWLRTRPSRLSSG